MKTGYVIFVHNYLSLFKPASWLSYAIRLFTRTQWNHAAIVLTVGTDILIVEAKGKGVVATHFDIWLQKDRKYSIREPRYMPDDIERKIASSLGKEYDFVSLLFYQVILRITGKWIGSTGMEAQHKLYCSELVADCFNMPNAESLSTGELERSGLFDKEIQLNYL